MAKRAKSKDGKKFNSREVHPTSEDGIVPQANQWVATEQQLAWLNYYMNPREKETYANAYQSAIKAGYSAYHAKVIATKNAPEWTKAGKTIMRSMNVSHLRDALEEIVTSEYASNKDQIAAVKLLGIDLGMFVQKQIVTHTGIEEALEGLE